MQHIHTPAQTVSKLKKAAKLLTRTDPRIQHARALDRVAEEAGYCHWKHVTDCAEQSEARAAGSQPVHLTGAQCADPRFSRGPTQDLIFITGRSGSGKSTKAMDYALNGLREGRAVRVIDVGCSYRHMSRLVGGTFITFAADGSKSVERHGDAHFVVFELEGMMQKQHPAGDCIPFKDIAPNSLLIVDELWQVRNVLGSIGALSSVLSGHLEAGGSVALVSQDHIDEAAAFSYIGDTTGRPIRRSLVSLGRG